MRGRPRRQSDVDLAERLRAAQLRSGISDAQLASALGVSPSTISRSLGSGRFSTALASRARAVLADDGTLTNGLARSEALDRTAGPRYEQVMLLLHKLHLASKMLIDVQDALGSLLDPDSTRG